MAAAAPVPPPAPPAAGEPACTPSCCPACPPMLPDLSFRDAPLEAAFERRYQRGKRSIVARFAFYRGAALAFISCRALAAGDPLGALLLLIATAASFLPLLAVQGHPAGCGIQAAILLVDVMQAAIGCVCIRHISPSRRHITPISSLAHLVHASCVLWPHMYSRFSPLLFKRQLVGQAAVTAVLLAFNRVVCRSSLGLRLGYRTAQRLLHAALCPLLAALGGAAARQHCSAPPPSTLEADMQLCQSCQVAVLLLPAFAAALWGLYRSERRLRLEFVRELTAELSGTSSPAASPSAGSSSSGRWRAEPAAVHGDELAALRALPPDVACLATNASLAPDSLDFFLNFAVPALAALWSYARWPMYSPQQGAAAAAAAAHA